MESGRITRQLRKSPVRYHAGPPVKRERSRSKNRKPKTPDKGNKKRSDTSVERRRSPSRNAKSPSRASGRLKIVEDIKVLQKSSSPVPASLIERPSSKLEEIIRSSLTPDRAKMEDIIRTSVSRFENVMAEVMPDIKRRTISTNRLINEDLISERVDEYTAISESNDIIEQKITNNLTNNNNKNNYALNSTYQEFGGLVGIILLMFLQPITVVIAQFLCIQDNCTSLPTKVVLSLRRFFDLDAFLWYIGYILAQLILTAIPLGPKLYGVGTKGNTLSYWRNGPASIILMASLLGAAKYYLEFPIVKMLDKTLPLLIAAICCSLVVTILIQFLPLKDYKSRNSFANRGNFIYDMWMGKEINPRLGPCDIKLSLIRSSFIFMIMYDCLLLLKEVETKSGPTEYSMMLILYCCLQIQLAFDILISESSLLSSFFITQEGTGYNLLMGLAVIPFWVTLLPKYLYFMRPSFNEWIAGAIAFFHLTGYTIYKISILQNDGYHRSPLSLKSSDILYSRHPEKIYRGGLRSKVRYPEYSGLLIIILSWCIGSIVITSYNWVPITLLLAAVITIIMQTKRMDKRNNFKHNLTWNTYLSSTPWALIPYIY